MPIISTTQLSRRPTVSRPTAVPATSHQRVLSSCVVTSYRAATSFPYPKATPRVLALTDSPTSDSCRTRLSWKALRRTRSISTKVSSATSRLVKVLSSRCLRLREAGNVASLLATRWAAPRTSSGEFVSAAFKAKVDAFPLVALFQIFTTSTVCIPRASMLNSSPTE